LFAVCQSRPMKATILDPPAEIYRVFIEGVIWPAHSARRGLYHRRLQRTHQQTDPCLGVGLHGHLETGPRAATRADTERDVLDFLSKPHSNPDLVRACKEVLEYIGTASRFT